MFVSKFFRFCAVLVVLLASGAPRIIASPISRRAEPISPRDMTQPAAARCNFIMRTAAPT